MVTADQLVAHVIGDYFLQSDWLASQKTTRALPAAIHAILYSLPFLVFTRSPRALLVICVSHFVIDRWRLARGVRWLTNRLAPPHQSWAPESGNCDDAVARRTWLAQWLVIVVDNTLHVVINSYSLRQARDKSW
jgi:hypothetical protein